MTNPNGTTFPTPLNARYGLTKREHFAESAMNALISNPDAFASSVIATKFGEDPASELPKFIARTAIAQADALIAELNRTQP